MFGSDYHWADAAGQLKNLTSVFDEFSFDQERRSKILFETANEVFNLKYN